MADDESLEDDDFEALDEGELDESGLEDEEIAADEELEDEEIAADEELPVEGVAEEKAVEEPAARARKKRDDEEEDEEEVDPDDVEADLDTILKDRIAAGEEDDEEEELEEQDTRTPGEVVEGVSPKKANEFMCTGCFLLVHPAQFGPPDHLECPVGEEVCPGLAIVRKQLKVRK
jgi:hypothetical protein